MNKGRNEIINTLDHIQEVTEMFYQQNNKEAFDCLLNILDEITDMIDIMSYYSKETLEFEFDDNKVYNMLKQIMEALETGDEIMMADILQYDFCDYISKCLQQMK